MALKVQVNLLDMQPQFQDDLRNNLSKFRQDKLDYCNEYRTAGPMQSSLTPREALDRLILFQVSMFLELMSQNNLLYIVGLMNGQIISPLFSIMSELIE
ncbi:hypothetical protein JTB14_009621 [Gonioctena quinquepunctata]|nr:hypothetical protein JTB14_009621 [Gonioctena quinquepunctata]